MNNIKYSFSSPFIERCINTLRCLCIDMIQKANSGHPGMAMGIADVAFVLWTQFLKYNHKNTHWFNRDRFILSAGHGSSLLYALLYMYGHLTIDDLKSFRQWQSNTPGHPEKNRTPGVEFTTGPLGQGFAAGIGMALAEKHLAQRFNKDNYNIIDHYTYAIISDGDIMEGITSEASSLAGHLKLSKLIYLYDANKISIDGNINITFSDDVKKIYEGYQWHVQTIDGHNKKAIANAIKIAQQEISRPSLIICNTHIGYGSPNKQDHCSSHGAPLGIDEVVLCKKKYGFDPQKHFEVEQDVLDFYQKNGDIGIKHYQDWQEEWMQYTQEYEQESTLLKKLISRQLPDKWEEELLDLKTQTDPLATRSASGMIINGLKKLHPFMIGGSADLTDSNNTKIHSKKAISASHLIGHNIYYGVREHAMVGCMNGIAAHGGLIPYGGTFLIFSDYFRPALRIAALSKLPIILVLTHDSIGLGEDGPTHQPIEHIASLRSMPNVNVIRPADMHEVREAWKVALKQDSGPTLLILTRQKVPILPKPDYTLSDGFQKGAYIFKKSIKQTPNAIIISSGSELHLGLEVHKKLQKEGYDIQVVSMPSWELFEQQTSSYQEMVLPPKVSKRIYIEASKPFGWEKWIGKDGLAIGINNYGYSAPSDVLFEKMGFGIEEIHKKIINYINT